MSEKIPGSAAVFALFLCVSPSLFSQETPSEIKTLSDAYHLALKNNERITISEQFIRQAEGLYRQALGSSFPELSYRRAMIWRDKGTRAGTNRVADTAEQEGMFRLTISGLTGYREYAAVKAGKSGIRQREFEMKRAEQLMLSDIAAAYFGVLQAQENSESTIQLKEFADKRFKELKERVRVGRSRTAESVGQEVQMTGLESQLEETQRAVGARLDLLEFLAGAKTADSGIEDPLIEDHEPKLEDYLARVDTRPDVRAAQQSYEIARRSVQVARAGHFPDVDFTGNYYTDRPDAQEEVDWDASLNLDIPIWSWGAVQGEVDAAQADLAIQEQVLSAARRQGHLEIQNAYRNFISARRQMELLRRGTQLARRDYELQVQDDKRGLVTNLEVLESLNRLNTAELTSNSATLVYRLAALNLEIAAGAAPEELLK